MEPTIIPSAAPAPQSPAVPQPQPTPPIKKSTSILKVILIVLAVAAASAAGGYLFARNNITLPFQRACTLEAKLCPDGSSVGRSGPDCEFSPCPTPIDSTASWEIYQSALLSFKYPQGWVVNNSAGQSSMSSFYYFIDIKNSSYQYGPEPSTISISYWDNPQRLDIPTFQKQIKGKPIYKSGYAPAGVGEAAGYYTTDGPCEPVTCESYTVAYNDKIFIIDLFQPSTEQFRQIFTQILSTFKFTDQAGAKTTGDVSGRLCYPSEFIPPGEIIVKNVQSGTTVTQSYLGTESGGGATYTISLPGGVYHFKFQTAPDYSGYYTECAKNPVNDICSLDTGHQHIDVSVAPDQVTNNIDLCDFYATEAQRQALEQTF